MQAPGGRTGEPTKGFNFSGWVIPYRCRESGEESDRVFKKKLDLLLGHKTHEIFAAYWAHQDEDAPNGRIASTRPSPSPMRLRPLVLVLAVGACHQPTTPDPALRAALVHRADLDQAQMQALAAHWGDTGYQRQLATTLLTNATWLDSVVTRRGWPGLATADSDGAAAAYLIAQHADALPEAQARFLEALRLAVHRGDARLVDLAYLEDRVRKAQGRPQLYGTQPAYDSTGRALQPAVETPDSLDVRRAAVGLPPMAAYLEQLRAMNARLRATADSGAAH